MRTKSWKNIGKFLVAAPFVVVFLEWLLRSDPWVCCWFGSQNVDTALAIMGMVSVVLGLFLWIKDLDESVVDEGSE